MTAWLCIPSARPVAEAEPYLQLWRDKGYRIALHRDPGAEPLDADLLVRSAYHGWPAATNALCRAVLAFDPDAEWCVCGGDDMKPDPNLSADEIAAQCSDYFTGTEGVMQPTGDRFMVDASGRCAAERICGSPWLGREFIASRDGRVFDEGFRHFFADERLLEELIGTPHLWQRPDLTHHHDHWTRHGQPKPPHMEQSLEWWRHDQAAFETWKAGRLVASRS